MFFHKTNFQDILTDDQANLVAKMANDILDQNSTVFFGEYFNDGSAKNFTNEKKQTDSHVCLAVGIETMGRLKPSSSPIKLDRPNSDDLVKAQAERLKMLERELRQLRGSK